MTLKEEKGIHFHTLQQTLEIAYEIWNVSLSYLILPLLLLYCFHFSAGEEGPSPHTDRFSPDNRLDVETMR
jgi:hypothetical protein